MVRTRKTRLTAAMRGGRWYIAPVRVSIAALSFSSSEMASCRRTIPTYMQMELQGKKKARKAKLHVLLSRALLALDQARSAVDANNQTTSHLKSSSEGTPQAEDQAAAGSPWGLEYRCDRSCPHAGCGGSRRQPAPSVTFGQGNKGGELLRRVTSCDDGLAGLSKLMMP